MTSQPGYQTITMHTMSNISRSKSNQIMKFGLLIENHKINIFLQKSCKKRGTDTSSRPLSVLDKALYKADSSYLQLSFNIFRQLLTWHTIKSNCIKLQTIDPEISLSLIFQKRVWEQYFHHILCMIFEEKFFSFHLLITDQISLSDCLYFLRYRVICALQLFVSQVVTS